MRGASVRSQTCDAETATEVIRASAGMRLLAHEVAHTLQGPGRASLRRTPESEAVDTVDTGDDLLAQSKSIQSAVDGIRADLERVLVDLASSELEGYAVPETLRKRTVCAKTRYRKITRSLDARVRPDDTVARRRPRGHRLASPMRKIHRRARRGPP